MAEENLEKISGFIPEFVHDVIARIVPGAVILLTLTTYDFANLKDSPVLGAIGCTVLSYVVGYFADISTVLLTPLLLTVLRKCGRIGKIEKFRLDKLKPPRRDLAVKIFAEGVLCRVMFAYVLCHVCLSAFQRSWLEFTVIEIEKGKSLRVFPFFWALAVLLPLCFCWVWVTLENEKRTDALLERQRDEAQKRMTQDLRHKK